MTRSVDNVSNYNREMRPSKGLVELLADLNLNISSNPQGTDKGDFKTYVRGFYEGEFSRRRSDKNRFLK